MTFANLLRTTTGILYGSHGRSTHRLTHASLDKEILIVNCLQRFDHDIYHKTVPRPSSAGTFSRGPETCPSGIPCCRTWTCPCTGSTRLPETSRTTRKARPGMHSSATRCPWRTCTPSGDCTGSCRTLRAQLKSDACHITINTVETTRHYVMYTTGDDEIHWTLSARLAGAGDVEKLLIMIL